MSSASPAARERDGKTKLGCQDAADQAFFDNAGDIW